MHFTEYDHVVQAFPADRAEERARNAGKIDLKQWSGTLIAFFLGQVKLDQMSPPSSHSSMGRARGVQHSYRALPRRGGRNEAHGEVRADTVIKPE